MPSHLSPFEKLAPQILANIGLYAGTSSFLGPPTDLVALLSASHALYRVLSYTANKHLWAQVFQLKFDIEAVDRRLGERWTTSGCIAAEGRKRFAALKRIRHNVIAEGDLWTAYLMMLESDGRNQCQLMEWSKLRDYLYRVIFYRASTRNGSSALWFSDTEGTALTIWLLWMISTPESIRDEHPQLRAEMRALLHPFLVAGSRFPSFQTPDSHFELPLCPSQTIAPHTSGPSPKARTLRHWSHKLTIAAPAVTSAAFLCIAIRIEALQDISPLSGQATMLPADRATANALGLVGKTLEDVKEFQYNVRTRFVDRCPVEAASGTPVSIPGARATGSRCHDGDWRRLVCCFDPWDPQPAMRGAIHKPGVLSGSWDGRVMLPHIQQYWSMILDPAFPPSSVGLTQDRISLEIQEHHCLSPDEPLSAGADAEGWGDDILHAFLPKGTTVRHVQEAIVVYNPITGRHTRYETFVPGRPSPYSAAATAKLQAPWVGSEAAESEDRGENMSITPTERQSDGSALPADQVIPIDDDDEWEDTVEHLSTGVRDILITGKTSQRQGDAWGHFNILGRIRPWDGLCVFLRVPTDPQEAQFGNWIFKGYIHDDTLVGRWRETSTSVESIGWEGGFVMCKAR